MSEVAGLQMKYFVLKPRGHDDYARASRRAMRAYAEAIREQNRRLSDELREWADNEHFAAQEMMPRPAGWGEGGKDE